MNLAAPIVKSECLPSHADVEFYRQQGYWISPKIFEDDELEEIRARQDKIYTGQYETGRPPWHGGWKFKAERPFEIRKTDNSHWCDSVVARAVLHPTLGAIAARLHAVDVVRLWHDQLLYKPPGGGHTGNVGWHQDFGYWRACKEPNLLTAWIALCDMTPKIGSIMMVPGSHKRGLLNASDFFNQDLDGLTRAIEAETRQPLQAVPVLMKAGQVSFHHCLTIHGSGENRTDWPRRSIAVHLMAGVVHRDIRGKHMNTELVELQDGDPFEAEVFPVLYQAPSRQVL